MSNSETTAEPMAREIILPVEWRQPYPDLEVFRLFVGPFYAGEVARTITEGWKATSPLSGRPLSHPSREMAMKDVECCIRMAL